MKTLIRKALVVAALCVGSASITPQVYAQHGLLREIYPNLNSTGDITSLTSNANYPNNPASVTVISEFEAPDSQGDLYGQRVRGYVEAPETGDYIFWISSDDQSQLFLSSSEQPENKVKIAEVFNYTGPRQWDAEPNQQSSPIHLDEGKRYYIEAIMVNGFGDSHLAVRWQLPDGTIEEPIPNERVYAELIRPTITRQPPNVTVAEGQPATFTVQVANRAPISYQWYRNDVAIPGATNASFSIPVTAVTDSSSRFQVRLFNDFATNGVASTIAFLTVNRDTTPPTIVSVQTSGESDLLTVTFSEPVDPTTGTDPANYTVLGGPQVLGASLDSSGRTVILKTTPMGIGQSYTVLINNVLDRSSLGNVIEPDTTADFAFGFSPLDSDLVYGKPESPGPSTRRTALTFSEIMYHPAPRTDARNVKFIEIYNSGATLESVGGYRITGAIDYTFPEGTFIPATNYAVVAAVPVDMQILYGLPKVYGPFTNDLPDSGTLRLRNRQGAVLLDLTYDSKEEWPVAPDGEGPSLVLARPSYGEADPRAWAGSQFAGGSPGKAEPVSANPYRGLVINEFLAHSSTQLNFVELYNYSSQPIDLSGVLITDSLNTNKFRIKNGTTIAPFGFVSFDEIDLEFALSAGGERLIVRNPQQTRVIDTIKFGAQANGLSTGRFPDGSPEFQVLSQPTPKGANSRPLLPGVVINEIMYNPISGNGDEEYVELYNRSATNVDLTGWRIGGGISFAFTQNTILAPGAYLAVAKNVDLLRTNHPGTLGTSNSVGNFNGSLSNSGDRVALERPEVIIATNATSHATNVYYVVVNEMKYGTGGHWPTWANGGGSSMELVDPNSNNAEAANWGDSDETQKSIWYTFERRGILDNGPTNNTAQTSPIRNLHIFLEGAGEALLDNVQVFRDGQPNVVSNPGFENGLTDWLLGGTHDKSTLERGVGNNSTNSLHIRASERGDTSANRLRVRLTSSLTNGQIATLRADVRWLRGNPEILLRLHGNYLEAPGVMPVPKNLGTPGQPNSRLIADSGPTITAVQHTPILPVANQAVTVIARVDDPDRVALVAVNYRVDPNTNYTRVPMTYSGAGYYSGVIPGQTNLATVPFYIETLDARGATARFPSDAPNREGVILFGDGSGRGSFATYHLWLSRTNINRWTTREQSSNEPLDATFVYNNERIIYNMGALYSGSPFHWRGYNGPLGNSANYLITFPDDDLFLGQNSSVLNLPSNLASDNTGVREQTFFWMAEQVSQPHNHRRYHYLFLNGLDRDGTSIFEDAQQPNGDMIKEWFPNDTGGDLYKIEDWFEYSDTFNFFNMDSELVGVWTTNLVTGARELKQERYRWWFRKRAVHDSAHDYSELLRLVLAVNNTNVDQFVGETQSLVDIDEWMGAIAIRHMAGDWDSYGYSRGKNMYAYKPPGGKWNLMHWDIAFAFGLGDPAVPLDPTSSGGLFDVSHFGGSIDPIDTITKKMMDTPVFRRAYFRAFYDLVNGPMQSARVNSVIDTKFDSLLANGINASAPDTVKNWIAQRRDYILAQLGSVSASFSITNNGGNNFTTNRNTVMLAGTAPVNVKSIRVNGAEYPVTWTSATTWQIPLALKPQLNLIRIEGYDSSGQLIADAADTITINVTNAGEPLAGNVVINEIQYHAAVSGTEFIEIFNKARITSFDLSGYRLNGAGFDFPPGSVITPGGFLVIAKDAAAFGEQYGFNIPVVGEFSGTLQNGGEALTLVGPGAGGTNVVLSGVRYDNALPWPSAADGSGGSLQLIDPSQDPARVANWAIDGTRATPGATNSVRGTLAAFPAVWVNEVQAVNLNGPADSAGNRDPWLELYNSGSSAVSLAGYYLTDDTTNLTKWPFPTGASIAPGQRLIIWLDGQPAQSTSTEWHTSFRLAAASGSIALVGTQRNAPAVFDYLKFDQVPDGQSYGAFPEGQAVTRATFSKPTPGASNDNSSPAVHVLINEWMASNTHTIQDPDDLAFNDWFELYNAGSDPADLSGYTLTDDLTKPAQSSLPQATVIPPHGFLFVWADGDHSTNGQVHVSFKLSASGDTIALLAPDGSTVDLVTFGSQAADVSEGRSPDGSSNIATQAVATPGAPNGGLDPNALQFRSVSIAQGSVTLTWNGVAGSTYAVLYKNSLTDASWTQLRTVAATGSTTSTTDTVSGASRFYRIQKL